MVGRINMKFFEAPKQPKPEEIEKIFEGDPTIDAVFTEGEQRSPISVVFRVPELEGRELPSGHRLGFVIPKELQRRIVRDIILQHRKGEKFRASIGADRHDAHGAYSRVEVYDEESGMWTGWQDPKGYSPDKFAEPRSASDPENEVLHDWVATVGEVKPSAVRVTNVGDGHELSVSQIHGLEVTFFPELKNVSYDERIYCKGTRFIDLERGEHEPQYGGGSHTEGEYIWAIPLGGQGSAPYELSSNPGPGASLEGGYLEIQLEPGRNLVQVEAAVGDTERLNHINPKTNRHTRLGYAKLWMGIKKAETGETKWFVENANIPPQGVIAGGPFLADAEIKEGDTLVIEARQDTAYLMGWRVAYT